MQKKMWNNKAYINPVNMVRNSALREEFTKYVIGIDVRLVEKQYISNLFQGKGMPPFVVKSEKEMVEFVSQNRSAIGYLSSSYKDKVKGVKIAKIFYGILLNQRSLIINSTCVAYLYEIHNI